MSCIFEAKGNSFDKCENKTVEGSGFCQYHIESDQNACTEVIQTKTVHGWDTKKNIPTKNRVSIHCNKMRQVGSTLCPHHALLENKDNHKKAQEMKRKGGYEK